MAYTESNMQSAEDLATLFSRHMTLQQPRPVLQAHQEQPSQQLSESEPEPIKYSISQHYHHSTHVVHQVTPTFEAQRPSSVPPQTTQPSVEQVLTSHGISPNGLSPQQFELFKTADTPQQRRLLELWKIYPPTNSQQTNQTVAWATTTVEQEEFLAQLRHEQMLAERDSQGDSLMSLDGTPLTPVQTTDGHWVNTAYVEPYMTSGYEMLARREYEDSVRRQLEEESSRPKEVYNSFGAAVGGLNYRLATDPVYASDWPNQKQAMEDQYGKFQQMSDMEF
ncbi:hypothetical protein GGS21DRAFT_270070 [Xylaria nigripes]|nr:hypothetical protein GGS21DRAFT_270070 [Xylaria nigripes]